MNQNHNQLMKNHFYLLLDKVMRNIFLYTNTLS